MPPFVTARLPRSRPRLRRPRPGTAAAAVAALLTSGLVVTLAPALDPALAAPVAPAASPSTAAQAASDRFVRTATYPVFRNVPAGVDPAEATVAEISDVSQDGRTVVYTDAEGRRIGFLDITDPAAPVGTGTVDVAALGAASDSPTSLAVVGDHVLVAVDTSTSFTEPSGRVDVIDLATRTRVASHDLGGQPDSIAVSPSGDLAAIAMENQRDEDVLPDGAGPDAEEGDLPQAPAGFVQVLDLDGDPSTWVPEPVVLDAAVLTGVDTPEDAEPEYVDINDDNELVLSLQENNGLVIIDLTTRTVVRSFSAGSVRLEGVDTTDDGVFNAVDTVEVPREPDSVQWVGQNLVATANEGDWKGGSRGWSVFDTTTGEVVWDAGTSFEDLVVAHGSFNDGRADNKGAEPEGLAFARFGETSYAFVGSERSNLVAVYDMTDPAAPAFVQALPTTNGPEGLLPVPSRDLLVVSSEVDDAKDGIRSTVALFELGGAGHVWPDLVSEPADGSSRPIGWGALGALTPDLRDPAALWSASDAAYSPARLYRLDVSSQPAVLDQVLEVTENGTPVDLDVEGIASRPQGGFWLAAEGATGPKNELVRVDDAGAVQQRIALPAEVAAGLSKWGLEGIAVRGAGAAETAYVALQRPLTGETAARIGRLDVATGTWTWFGYPLETTAIEGDWIGLSEITVVDHDTLAVIERDKQVGTTAAVKRVYTVDLPAGDPAVMTAVEKTLALDVLPLMEARNGWTQEKLEGLGVTTQGEVYAVTDNDGVDDATGETQLFALGRATEVFEADTGTTTTLRVRGRSREAKQPFRLVVRVRPGAAASGEVVVTVDGEPAATAPVEGMQTSLSLRIGEVGRHRLVARYSGGPVAGASVSDPVVVRVRRR